MTLSIIIPVYNVECVLSKCLDSVLTCELTDCEIILSMRQSADASEKICKEYQERHSVIRLVYQDGIGLSNARNCGMRLARGDYILFIDSDDYVDSVVLNNLIARLRAGSVAPDVMVTDYAMVEHPSGKIRTIYQIGKETPDQTEIQFLTHMLRSRQCFWNVWRYIYRRSFLEQNGIMFVENTLSEDVDFTTSVFLAEPKIIFSHSPYYYYNVGRGESLMDRPTLKRLRETVSVLTDCIDRLRTSSFQYATVMLARFQFEYILNMALAVEIGKEDRRSALSLYKNWDRVLRNSSDPLIRVNRVFLRIFGVEIDAWFLHCLKMIRRRIMGRSQIRPPA